MEPSLKTYRDRYLDTLLHFLWREWSAVGVAGQETASLRHVVDPDALLLFTCSIGRYDQRLFDAVVDWLVETGQFLNIQRIRNILRKEGFRGGRVLGALADWLAQHGEPSKWKLLAGAEAPRKGRESLCLLPDGRPLPSPADRDPIFFKHGLIRNPLKIRGYARPFPTDTVACTLLKMRALFGVNSRCDTLMYLMLNGAGHPREVAREMYYSQKAVHDVMTDMARSGIVVSARFARERTFRIVSDMLSPWSKDTAAPPWINWPVLLSVAETVWYKIEELRSTALAPVVESSEITLTMRPLLDRILQSRWVPTVAINPHEQGLALLRTFQTTFETLAE